MCPEPPSTQRDRICHPSSSAEFAPREKDSKELAARLECADADVLPQVLEIVRSSLDAEQRRTPVIDARATALVGTAGLSITVAFTFGASMVRNDLGLTGCWLYILPILYLLAMLAGVSAAGLSLFSLLVRQDYPVVDADAVFREEAFEMEDPSLQLRCYQRQIAVHLWTVCQSLTSRHIRKAKLIRRAQVAFFFFLLMVTLIGVVIAMSSTIKTGNPVLPATPSTSSGENARATVPSQPQSNVSAPNSPAPKSGLSPIGPVFVADGGDRKD